MASAPPLLEYFGVAAAVVAVAAAAGAAVVGAVAPLGLEDPPEGLEPFRGGLQPTPAGLYPARAFARLASARLASPAWGPAPGMVEEGPVEDRRNSQA